MSKSPFHELSMRERQVMDVLHRLRSASVSEVVEEMREPPSYDAVRMTLTMLDQKGVVTKNREGRRFVYAATQRTDRVRRSALEHLLATFFQGSVKGLVSTLLGMRSARLSEEDLDELEAMIAARRRAKSSGDSR